MSLLISNSFSGSALKYGYTGHDCSGTAVSKSAINLNDVSNVACNGDEHVCLLK